MVCGFIRLTPLKVDLTTYSANSLIAELIAELVSRGDAPAEILSCFLKIANNQYFYSYFLSRFCHRCNFYKQ